MGRFGWNVNSKSILIMIPAELLYDKEEVLEPVGGGAGHCVYGEIVSLIDSLGMSLVQCTCLSGDRGAGKYRQT